MRSSPLILSSNLREFFKHEITDAAGTLGVSLDDLLEYYVVNLLCDFSRSDQSPTPGEEPLAFIYKRAVEASPLERIGHLKELGDLSLYVAGFFTEFIERSLVDIDYYISMGGNAYASLSDLLGAQPSGDTFAEVYSDLADRFPEVVDVLNEVNDRSMDSSDNDTDLLRLYDRWQKTKSQRIERKLTEKGLIPVESPNSEYVQ
ncbi:MAG: hypothetical protein AAFQ82_00750 [Myxococcota bacterium]